MKFQYLGLLALVSVACSSSPKQDAPPAQTTHIESLLGTPVKSAKYSHKLTRRPTQATTLHSVNYDGCYQLVTAGAMYPAICLSGTMEEGINGAGVRMAIFHTNTDILSACAKSSRSGIDANTYFFEADGKKQLILSDIEVRDNKPVQGKATIGSTQLSFVFTSQADYERLMAIHSANQMCQSVDIGQVKPIR